jgi:energy-coupling factor transporter ATP-binding protein EcfA2
MVAEPLGERGGIGLAARAARFTYPDGTEALRGVDVEIAPGEVVGIIGQNGSGKSTLVRHLNGLLRASAGEILVDGAPVRTQHVAELSRKVAIAFQNPDRQIFAGSVRAEATFGAHNAGLRGATLRERVSASLELVGLAGVAEINPYDLGHSRRKLLTTASAVAMGTPAIVLDEPTTGLDARGAGSIRSLVERLHDLGRTVVIISHDMRFVATACTRVTIMHAGRVIGDGTPAEVFAEQHWPALRMTHLEPPVAATVGARLGLGPTPTAGSLVDALRRAGEAASS